MRTRAAEFFAMTMIGDGMLAVLVPRKHALRWADGPWPWRRSMRAFARNPMFTRAAGAAQVGAGIWLGMRLSARGR